MKGGATTISIVGDAGSLGTTVQIKAAASDAVLFIFQLPTINVVRTMLSARPKNWFVCIVLEKERLIDTVGQCNQTGQLFTLEQFQRGATAG